MKSSVDVMTIHSSMVGCLHDAVGHGYRDGVSSSTSGILHVRRRSTSSSIRLWFGLVVFLSAFLSIQTSPFLSNMGNNDFVMTTSQMRKGESFLPPTSRIINGTVQHHQEGNHSSNIIPIIKQKSTTDDPPSTPFIIADVTNSTDTTTTTTTDAGSRTTTTSSSSSFDIQKIPKFMIDYFEWHKEQLRLLHSGQLSWTAHIDDDDDDGDDDDDDDRHSNVRHNNTSEFTFLNTTTTTTITTQLKQRPSPRFLILRCIEGDRCGGTSDRLKAFPLFIYLAYQSDRILFIRWGINRPFPLETFIVPGPVWNWTVPTPLLSQLEMLDERDNDNESSRQQRQQQERVYYDGTRFKELRRSVNDDTIRIVEGNDYTGGGSRYERLLLNELFQQQQQQEEEEALKDNATSQTAGDLSGASNETDNTKVPTTSHNNSTYQHPDTTITSTTTTTPTKGQRILLQQRDAYYTSFYHDLFHASFQPSQPIRQILSTYFDYAGPIPGRQGTSQVNDGIGIMAQNRQSGRFIPNQYIVVHYRAKYPGEPYRERWDRTVLEETTLHAVQCAHSIAPNLTTIYVTSDTALVLDVVRSAYSKDGHNSTTIDRASPSSSSSATSTLQVWTHLDVEHRGEWSAGGKSPDTAVPTTTDSSSSSTTTAIASRTPTTGLSLSPPPPPVPVVAVDPPHLNFAQLSDPTGFYGIFVDLFLMSHSYCVTFGAGGFGRLGSLASYHPTCGIPHTMDGGILQNCTEYIPSTIPR